MERLTLVAQVKLFSMVVSKPAPEFSTSTSYPTSTVVFRPWLLPLPLPLLLLLP